MKCSKCGNNNTTFHYKANINGQITEMHLCPECAEKAGYTPEKLFGDSMFGNRMFGKDMFVNGFGSMFDSMFGNFYRDFFAPVSRGFFSDLNSYMMPMMAPPMMEMFVHSDEEERKEKVSTAPDAEMSRRREINALREQLNNAIKAEEYEKAAELRDKIRGLEKKED